MAIKQEYKEGQTPLSEDESQALKIKSITTQGNLNAFEQLNIQQAFEWTISYPPKPTEILTEQFVKKLHKKMYGDVWKWAGEFRQTEKNIGIPWIQIGTSLRQLLDNTRYWIDNQIFPSEKIAIKFKHGIVLIHCFPNGNGRHSRMMADIIMQYIFNEKPFSWHQSNMVNANEIRAEYICALKAADQGNINPLIKFAQI